MSKKSIYLFTCVIGVGIFLTALYIHKSRPSLEHKVVSTNQEVILDNSNYYLNILPYISDDVQPLPINLPNGILNPDHYVALQASGFHNEYLPLTDRLYMVQYKKPPTTEMYMDTRPIRTFSTNTFVISADSDLLKQLVLDPNINFIDNYQPHYKLSPDLIEAYYNGKINTNTKLVVIFSPFALPAEIQGILHRTDVKPSKTTSSGQYCIVSGLIDREALFTYAMNPLISEVTLKK